MTSILGNESALSETLEGEETLVSGKASRKTYSKPNLACFGNVAKLTQNGGGSSSDGTGNSMVVMASDPSIKENIVKIGSHPLGIGLYLFDYKPEYRQHCGSGRQFGVMADEVESVFPEAVTVHPDGYRMVNYTMLGICQRIQ